jgi:DNA-binding transcriptional ArsR family regulator
MPSPSPVVPVFAALADPHRLRIVRHLSDRGPQSLTRLTVGSGISRQAIAKHVRVLEHAGVVRSFRRGRERELELRPQRLAEAERYLEEVSARWDVTLDRFRRWVESSEATDSKPT